MEKPEFMKVLDCWLRHKPELSRREPLFLEDLEPRILYSAAPLEVEAPANLDAQTVVVAPAVLPEEPPSAVNPGSLGNALQAPAIRVIDCLQPGSQPASEAGTYDLVKDLATAAAQRWEQSGLTQEQQVALASTLYEVRDLGGLTLAFEEAGTIVIDNDAAGRGWFVDGTPGDDVEFGVGSSSTQLLAQTPEAQAGVDLLTILMHEQGHVMGLADTNPLRDLMSGKVETGERLLPSSGQADGAVPGSLTGLAAATITGGQTVWINEIHYDNTSTDVGEFFEVAGVAGTSLSGWTIVLYNGANGSSYATINLSGTIDNEGGTGFGALSFLKSGIQDGAPDGLALVNSSGTVVEFLSYEGTFAAINGAAAGMTSVDIGVAESSTTPVGQSLQRDNSTAATPGVWYGPTIASSGSLNGDAPAMFSIAALSAVKAEGDSGATAFTFTVTRSGDTAGAATVDYAVTGSGADGADFAGGSFPSGTVSFAGGEASKTLTIQVQGDTVVEPDEGFTVTLSNPSTGRINTASATGTIQNDDSSFAIAALDAVKAEGNSGATAYTFTVTRTGNTAGAATVNYTVTGSGADGADFAGGSFPSGTVSFAGGEASKTLTIQVQGDTVVEPDEGFTVTLSNPSTGSITTASAAGTIQNDDSTFAIAALNAVQAEGSTGTTGFTFTVTRSGSTAGAATVDYAVTGNGADAADFAGGSFPSGTVSFAGGEASKTITIQVQTDATVEFDEGFTVTLGNPSTGSITTASAAGTIQNDDAAFTIAALNAVQAEGNTGTTAYTFSVTRSGNTAGSATVDYAVTGNEASAADFAGGSFPSGTVSFADGETSKTITVQVQTDTTVELDEGFTVTLSNPSTGSITTASAAGTIQNDDAAFTVAALDAVKAEGNSGITAYTFSVTRSGNTAGSATVDYAVTGNEASAADFAGGSFPSDTVSFADGETSKTITVQVQTDTTVELDEGFTVTLSNPSTGSITTASAAGTIQNDEAAGLVVDQAGAVVSIAEGGTLTFQVSLQGIPESDVTVTVTASEIDLGAGAGAPLILTFTPLNAGISQLVTATAIDDSQVNGNRSVSIQFLTSSSATGYDGLTAQPVTVNIVDNDSGDSTGSAGNTAGYSQSSFNLDNPTFGMPSASQFSVFAGFLPGSALDQIYSSSERVSGVIQPAFGVDWPQSLPPVLGGYTAPNGHVSFFLFGPGGRMLHEGSGSANEQGAFLILADMTGSTKLRLELGNSDGSVKSVVFDLGNFSDF